MALDKHRVAVDFRFPNGAFLPLNATEPLQLFRFFECELNTSKKTVISVPHGMKILLLCTNGTAEFSSTSTTLPLQTDSVILCAEGSYELTASLQEIDVEIFCLLFDVSAQHSSYPFSDLAFLSRFFYDVSEMRSLENANEVRRSFAELLSELSLPEPTMLLARGYFYQIMIEVYRQLIHCSAHSGTDVTKMNVVGQTVYAIVRYIDEHLFLIDNLMDMAKELGYSYNYLSHLFRRKTGMTIQAYVTQKKIEQSTKLLADERYSITEIATMLNYDCIQSFSKAFRRAMGVSPTEYRAGLKS